MIKERTSMGHTATKPHPGPEFYYIGQSRLAREVSIQKYIEQNLPGVDICNPRFHRVNPWSNRSSFDRPAAYLFPRFLFVAADVVPYGDILRVPDLTLVIENNNPVRVPGRFISELRSQMIDGYLVLGGTYLKLALMQNHERAALLASMFAKDWSQYKHWGEVVFQMTKGKS